MGVFPFLVVEFDAAGPFVAVLFFDLLTYESRFSLVLEEEEDFPDPPFPPELPPPPLFLKCL